MNDPNKPTRYLGPDRRIKPPTVGPAKPTLATTLPRNKPGGRHAAIGEKLATFREYKEWAAKARTKWDGNES